jgi:hypothetical protein
MRRTIGAGLALAVGGVLAGAAFAGTVSVPGLPTISTPTLPTVSTPTVPTITSPVPLPPPPPPPVKPPPPPSLPPAPTPPQTTVSVPTLTSTTVATTGSAPKPSTGATLPSGSTSSGSGGSTGGSSGSGSSSGPSSGPSSTPGSTPQYGGVVQAGRGTRQGSAVIRFIAPNAARAFVSVKQLFPSCAPIGHFSVRAHAGVNNVRFTGRLHGRKLQPGTYRFTVRARSGRVLRRVILVVVRGAKPTGRALAALRTANACAADTQGSGFSSTGSGNAGGTAPTPQTPQASEAGVVPAHGPNLHSGVLASAAQETARALEPLLIALLVASIVLFGVASLPREAVPGPRLHDALAQHRVELAGLGAAAFVAAVLAFFLT